MLLHNTKLFTFRVIKGNMMSQSQIAELVHSPWVIICQSLLHLFELLISLFAFPLYVLFSSKSRNFFIQRNFLSQSQVILKVTNFFLSITMHTAKQVLSKIRLTWQSFVMRGRPQLCEKVLFKVTTLHFSISQAQRK